MPALESIAIKGFKSIRDIKVDLRDINVMIGANGSGKSNFLEVFSLLLAIRAGHLQSYVARAGGAERLLHFGSRITKQIQIHLCFLSRRNEYEISLDGTDTDTLYPSSDWIIIF